jgi:hypothetical protein
VRAKKAAMPQNSLRSTPESQMLIDLVGVAGPVVARGAEDVRAEEHLPHARGRVVVAILPRAVGLEVADLEVRGRARRLVAVARSGDELARHDVVGLLRDGVKKYWWNALRPGPYWRPLSAAAVLRKSSS